MARKQNLNSNANAITLDELKEELIDSWDLEYSLLVMGPAGVGKSSIFKQVLAQIATGDPFAKYHFNRTAGCLVVGGERSDDTPEGDAREIATGYGFIDLRLSQVEPQDLAGIPMPENGITIRHLPNDMPVVGATHLPEKGLLLLDEVNQADMAVQKAMFSIVLDHKVDNKPFKKGWKVMAAGNRVEDSIAVSELCEPLKNRFSHYEVYASFEPFKKWATNKGVDPLVTAYLAFSSGDICHLAPSDGEYAFPTPRTWKQVSDKVKHWRELGFKRMNEARGEMLDMTRAQKTRGIRALIGAATAEKFVTFMDSTMKIDVEDYLTGKIKKVFSVAEINNAWSLISALNSYFLRGGTARHSDMAENRAEACQRILKYLANSNPFANMNELVQCLLEDLSLYDEKSFMAAIQKLTPQEIGLMYSHIQILLKTKSELIGV